MVLARTVRMRETCCDRGKKDYALLNAEGIVYISLVIITFNFFYFFIFFFWCECFVYDDHICLS